MILHIRNMVCPRCVMAVKQVLEQNDLKPLHIELGEVVLEEHSIDAAELQTINKHLKELGFELINNKQQQIIETIKKLVIERIYHQEDLLENQKFNWSDILSEGLHQDYKSLSRLFSSVEGITIEQYIIRQKIERVKELLIYDQFSLSEIAWKLGYSSVAHLSGQFQKVTGMTPTAFKKQTHKSRSYIDQL